VFIFAYEETLGSVLFANKRVESYKAGPFIMLKLVSHPEAISLPLVFQDVRLESTIYVEFSLI